MAATEMKTAIDDMRTCGSTKHQSERAYNCQRMSTMLESDAYEEGMETVVDNQVDQNVSMVKQEFLIQDHSIHPFSELDYEERIRSALSTPYFESSQTQSEIARKSYNYEQIRTKVNEAFFGKKESLDGGREYQFVEQSHSTSTKPKQDATIVYG